MYSKKETPGLFGNIIFISKIHIIFNLVIKTIVLWKVIVFLNILEFYLRQLIMGGK